MRTAFLVAGMFSLATSGCATKGPGLFGYRTILGDTNLAVAEPLFSKAEDECFERPDQLLALITGQVSDSGGKKNDLKCAKIVKQFVFVMPIAASQADEAKVIADKSRAATSTANSSANKTEPVLAPPTTGRYTQVQRNEIIDALLATSNQKCSIYSAMLKNTDGAVNASLSLAAIITGGLGSIVGGIATAKALSGSSSILSGSRAALNETYVSNQTIHVLTSAFEKVRQAQRRVITNRQACPVEYYSLMRGFEDAFAYHSSCSLLVGLAETARAVDRSDNPGIGTMRQQVAELTGLRRQINSLADGGDIETVRSVPEKADLAVLQQISSKLEEEKAAYDRARTALSALTDFAAVVASVPPAAGPTDKGPPVNNDWVADSTDTTERRKAKIEAQTERRADLKRKIDELGIAQQEAIDDLAGTARVEVASQAEENWVCPIRKAGVRATVAVP